MDLLSEFLVKNKIMLYSNEIDLDEAKKNGKEVWYDGVLCGYYLEDGFYSYSAFASLSRGNYKNALRISLVLAFLNMEKDDNILFEYMDLLCDAYFDTETFKVNRSMILNNIKKVKDGLYDVHPVVSKYFWVRPYNNIGLKDKEIDGVLYAGKGRVIMNQFNKTKRIDTINKIENAIQVLMQNRDMFITVADISNVSLVPKKTINKIYSLFKEEIDKYNSSVFNTDMYSEFIKNCNVIKISSAIKTFKDNLETKLTKRKVSKKTELHINTVYNLWEEDDVQEALEEYNNWLKNYK